MAGRARFETADVLQEADEGSSFAALLRRLPERAALTQEELAERAGLTVHAVSALERGTRTRPYPHTVRSLAATLGVSPAERGDLVSAVPTRRGGQRIAPASVHAPAPSGPEESDGSPRTRPAALVVPPTPLFGRDGDLAALASVIRSGSCRLLTLTGMGGVGKTRLAAALAAELAPDFPLRTMHVALAPVSIAAQVMDTIGRALGLTGGDAPRSGRSGQHLPADRYLFEIGPPCVDGYCLRVSG